MTRGDEHLLDLELLARRRAVLEDHREERRFPRDEFELLLGRAVAMANEGDNAEELAWGKVVEGRGRSLESRWEVSGRPVGR